LEKSRQLRKPRIAHQSPEWLKADEALANHRMPIDARAQRPFGVVQMECLQMPESDHAVEIVEAFFVAARSGPLDAGGEHVLGVQAHSHAPLAGTLQHVAELFEAAAHTRPLSGGELEQDPHPLSAQRPADSPERTPHAGHTFANAAAER